VLLIRIRCLFDPWIRDPGWVKKIRIRIRDEQPGSYGISKSLKKQFLGLKYLNSLMRIQDGKNSDPGWKKFISGINIPDPQHCA
jgi:hypothetical protein